MSSRAQARKLTSVLALCASGCSLLQLDNFGETRCTADHACDTANRKAGIDAATACRAYRCQQRTGYCELTALDADGDGALAAQCRGEVPDEELDCDDHDAARAPGKPERCETSGSAIDNDCDGLIDEGLLVLSGGPETPLDHDVSDVTYARADDQRTYLALTHKDQDELFKTAAFVLGDSSSPTISSVDLFADTNRQRCATDQGFEACNFGQLAIAVASTRFLAIGINHESCGAGQVRVGDGNQAGSGFQLDLSGAQADATLAYGLDLDGAQRCTKSSACVGAKDPALAALPSVDMGTPGEGLALWLAPDGDGADCASSTGSQVVGLGILTGEQGTVRLRGTHHGHSELILPHAVRSAPAVIAWGGAAESAGYFVGAASADGLELAFIPRFASHPESIRIDEIAGTIPVVGVQQLALAVGRAAEGSGTLGVAWRSGTGASVALSFAEVGFIRDAESPLELRGEILSLREGVETVAGPVVTYVPSGFKAEGEGWFVAWIERAGDSEHLLGMRIAATDHRLLERPKELAPQGSFSTLFAYGRDAVSTVGYIKHDAGLSYLVARQTSCASK
jgi:hypothetical protein